MQKTKLVVAVLGVAILIGLYFTVSVPIDSQSRGVKEFDLEIKDRKLNLNPPIIKLTQGDQVTFRIRADEEGEFHVHINDQEVEVEPGKISTIQFNATLAGRYAIAWHLPAKPGQAEHEEVVIGAVEVSPIG
ncbi:MAG: hypothetical protein FJ358_02670 [Thaumarchaeota archaeon]|nr:hypothetical protein [Nitrososphaerota archaeon]